MVFSLRCLGQGISAVQKSGKARPEQHGLFLLALLFFFAAQMLSAQTTWTGATSTDWSLASNWSAGVPDAADDVTIPDVMTNDPVIMNLTAALAKSVMVESGAVLTVNATGSLAIDDPATLALLNLGTVNNNGTITIGAVVSGGQYGLRNQATFNNNSNGEIRIDRTSNIGLWNNAGTFTNAGKITLGSIASINGPGVYNEADFQNTASGEINMDRTRAAIDNRLGSSFINSGKIVLGKTGIINGPGIYNATTFQNNAGGEIHIDRSGAGIHNQPSSSFSNAGKIVIGGVASIGSNGVYNEMANFENLGGEISIDRSGAGIHNTSASHSFINTGKISIGTTQPINGLGIYNFATFSNSVDGEINIDGVNGSGLFHKSSTFTNLGKINIGNTATINNPGLFNESVFNNNASGEISIDGIGGTNSACHNSYGASFTTSGKITIGGTRKAGAHGVFNYGTFSNGTGGEISIDRIDNTTTSNGIYSSPSSGGTFTNMGKITIGSAVSAGNNGVYNRGDFNNTGGEISIDHVIGTFNTQGLRHEAGTFTNTGKITIGGTASIGNWGLWNQAAFNNNAGGEISIDRSSTSGLRNESNVLTNAGKITIGSKASVGNWGIYNQAAFNNAGGEINIDNAAITGLRNQANSFTNTGKIAIGKTVSVGDWGIWNQAAFNNNAGGEISIDRANVTGLRNQSNTFTNSGKIDISCIASVGNWALWNEATFNNTACAVLNILAALTNNGTFTNDGLFTANTNGTHTNIGFTNNGILSYPQGNPIPNVTNNDLIVASPISTACGLSIASALQFGGTNTFTAGGIWYKNQGLTVQGGTYDQPTNTFTATNLTLGVAHILYFSVSDNANACPRTVSIQVMLQDAAPPTITCPANIARNTDPNQCTAVTTYGVTASDNCGYTLIRTSGPASGSAFAKGPTTVEWKATDTSGNMTTCAFTVTVTDAQQPNITCPSNIVRSTDMGQCNAVVTYTNPTYSDNCPLDGPVGLDHIMGGTSGTAFPKGSTSVVWQATDGTGLTKRCTFTITVNDNQLPTIACQANQTKSTDTNACTAAVTYVTPTGADNCGLPSGQPVWVSGGTSPTPSGSNSISVFQKGATTVTWKATDAVGLTKTCTFRVTVNDTQAPTINCPSSQNLNTDPNLCSAVASYSTPTATDNCTPPPTVVKTSGLASGSAFQKGNNVVVWRATDGVGLTKTCTFTVTVTDAQMPTIVCPADISVTGGGSPCTAALTYATPTATDNCTVQSVFLLSGLGSGSLFPAGVTTNVWRAVDNSGLSTTCAFTVTVGCGASPNPSEGGGNETAHSSSHSAALFFPPSEGSGEAPAVSSPPRRGGRERLTLNLMPNPALTEVTVSAEGLSEAGGELTVFDAQGKAVWQRRFGSETFTSDEQTRIDLGGHWQSGVYMVVLRSEGQVVTKRLVVSKL